MTAPEPVTSGGPGLGELAACLEAILFAAAEPLSGARLAAAVGVSEAQLRRALAELGAHLDAHGHAVFLAEIGGGFQLLTRSAYAETVAHFSAPRLPPLSRAALETLAIVAFRQPVTRAVIDELRGVHSEGAVATLLERGLIAEVGRVEAPGRPFLFGTTRRFLEHVGLRSLEELASAPGLARLLPERPRAARLPSGDAAAAADVKPTELGSERTAP